MEPGIPVPSPPDTIENISYSDTESEIDEVKYMTPLAISLNFLPRLS